MKNLIALIPIFLIFSCTQSKYKEAKKTVTIQGTIQNTSGKPFEIWKAGEKTSVARADMEEGKFRLTFELEEPGYFYFEILDVGGELFLEPGDELSLSATGSSQEQFDKTLSFSGNRAEENNYLLAYYDLWGKTIGDFRAFMEQEPDSFLRKLNESYEVLQEFHLQFTNDHTGISPFFVKTREIDIQFNKAFHTLNYPGLHKNFTKKEELDLPEDFYSHVEELDIDNPEAFSLPYYDFLLIRYLDLKLEKKFGKLSNTDSDYRTRANQQFDLLPELIDNGEKRNELYKRLALNYLARFREKEDKEGMDAILDLFTQRCDNEQYKIEVKVQYEEHVRLFPARPAPEFSYPDIDGQQVSLSDLDDKYVYVDIWATWCAPCLEEIPYLEELQAQFSNANLAFISISVDKNRKTWENMVKKKEMGGIQLIDTHGFDRSSGIIKDYAVSSIPHFILIGPGGIIVDSDAPRPSGKEIKEVLAGLISAPQNLVIQGF